MRTLRSAITTLRSAWSGFRSHETLKILKFCYTKNITLYRLPSHISHKLQPCDVGPFAPLKTAYHDQVERLNRGGVDVVGKEHFTYLYPAGEKALTQGILELGGLRLVCTLSIQIEC